MFREAPSRPGATAPTTAESDRPAYGPGCPLLTVEAAEGGAASSISARFEMEACNVEAIGIIGAGTMGNGIAQACAAAGLKVTMSDISDAAVARGMSAVSSSLERLVNKQKMTEKDPRRRAGAHHARSEEVDGVRSARRR